MGIQYNTTGQSLFLVHVDRNARRLHQLLRISFMHGLVLLQTLPCLWGVSALRDWEGHHMVPLSPLPPSVYMRQG